MCDNYELKKNIPLVSYGIICYRKNKNTNNTEILIIRRKDTIGYIEFLRGKYDIDNDDYIIELFNLMTINEKKRILDVRNFDKLRDMLGMTKKNSIYKQEYQDANTKFNILIETNRLDDLVIKSSTTWLFQEWGLPKGRKHQKETNMDCAVREFYEETLVNYNDIYILYNVKPLEEVYKSINNVIYKHIYYFAEYIGNDDIKIDYNNHTQMTEISDIMWADYNMCKNIIRPYYTEKLNIIKKGFQIIDNKHYYFDDLIL